MKFNLTKKEIGIFLVIGIVIFFLPIFFTRDWGSVSFGKPSEVGDTIGGITAPFLNFFGAVLIYLALKAQIDANKAIQDQFKIQQFEDKFYSMVEFHKENVEKMVIHFSDIIEFESPQGAVSSSGKLFAAKSRRDVEIKSFDLINGMIEEYILAIEAINKHYAIKSESDRDRNCELAYMLFFHGFEDSEFQKRIKSKFQDVKKTIEYFRLVFERRHSGDFQKTFWQYKILYPPFYGHSARLPHYFRNLYHTVKLVVENEKAELFDFDASMSYLKLLRSQLTNNEQLLIYLNYRYSRFGKSWDKLRHPESNNEFLTTYRMIHNIPVSNISNKFENPQTHFKSYISNHCTLENPLFEWGDYSS